MNTRLLGLHAIAATVLAAVILIGGFIPTNDGPVHLFRAFVWNHFYDAELQYPAYFWLNTPASSRGAFELFRLLEPLLGPFSAYTVGMVVVAEVWAVGFALFAHCCARASAWVPFLGYSLALQTSFYAGFFPFLLSCGLGFISCALLSSALLQRHNAVRYAVAALLFYVLASIHVVGGAFAGCAWLMVELSAEATWRRGAGVVAAALPSASVALVPSEATFPVDPIWADFGDRVINLFANMAPGPLWRTALLAAAVVIGLAQGGRSPVRVQRVLALTGLVLLLLALTLPRDLAGWQMATIRMIPWAVSFALLGLQAGRVAQVTVSALSIGTIVASVLLHVDMAQRYGPYVEEIKTMTPHPNNYHVVFERYEAPNIDNYAPLLHFGQLINIKVGGGAAWGQAQFPSIHQIITIQEPRTQLKSPIPVLTAPNRRALAPQIRSASRYGAVIFFGSSAQMDVLEENGFVPSFRSERIFVGDFASCSVDVTVDGVDGEAFLNIGARYDEIPVVVGFVHRPVGARRRFDLLPCGELWLKAETPQGWACAEANEYGYIHFRGRDRAVRCTLSLAPPEAIGSAAAPAVREAEPAQRAPVSE